MSVRMRHTSSHTKNRRSHHALKNRVIVKDKESGALRLPHRLDETTGMYRGKQILPKKVVKAEAKDHKKRVEAHKEEHVEGTKVPAHKEKKIEKASKVKGLTKAKAKANAAG
jgi:ribosomal protein L32